MNFFSKSEIKALGIIFGVLLIISIPNFILSLRRARDAQRKADIGSIYDSLNKYQADFGTFPLSVNGRIAACGPVEIKKGELGDTVIFSACSWNKDSLADLSDPNYPAYMRIIPGDPWTGKGWSYYYLSNGSTYQIYGSFEGEDEAEYDPKIIKRNLNCGTQICNFGKSFGKTPLDKSIEEYENEMNAKK
jgi:type II secretory pathway pseudopilin PulG